MSKRYSVEVSFHNVLRREETELLLRKVVKKPPDSCVVNYSDATVLCWSWSKIEAAKLAQAGITDLLTQPLSLLPKNDPRRQIRYWTLSIYYKET